MEHQFKTEAESCPNPRAILFHTNWEISAHVPLHNVIGSVEGVEDIPGGWIGHRYSFVVIIGKMFDREQVAAAILDKIAAYFKHKETAGPAADTP